MREDIAAGIAEVDEYLQARERLARRVYRSRVWELVAGGGSALASVALASRNIEQGGPWWFTTLCAIIVGAWALWAQAVMQRFRQARDAVAEVIMARASLQGADFTPLANLFTTTAPPAPDTTPETKP